MISFANLKNNRFFQIFMRLIVATILISIVATLINMGELEKILKSCRLIPLLHALFLFFFACISVGFSWMLLLRPCGYKISLLQAMRLSLLGFFFNSFVPSGVTGDVYRVFASEGMGVDRVSAVVSVFVERWSAFLALILATALSIAFAWPWLHGVYIGSSLGRFYAPLANIRLDTALLLFLILLILGFIGSSGWMIWASKCGNFKFEKYRFGISLKEFVDGVTALFSHKYLFLGATIINLSSPLLEGLAFSSVADSLGMDLSPLLFLVFTPIFRVLHHLPITVGAMGTQEIASVVFWQPLGALPEQAIAISIVIHVLKVAVGIAGGPLYFIGQGKIYAKDDKKGF